ncbi:C-type lectin domain family 4 member M-like [Micropterus salmoides]|uniref:C-type lectin domain family 4 member M-like n=1 Tax=Micropterus salmoides TaxID=27706 RepID=UPI0018ED64BD|nr:C-type lectin domain family 4 member M-like [Micropterus salmoides]
MEEIYANVEHTKPVDPRPSTNRKDPSCSKRRFYGAVFCLGVLSVFLLAGLIGLGVRSADLSAIKANLTERLQNSDIKLSFLTEERDLLNASLVEITEELNSMTADLSAIKANLTECLRTSDIKVSTLTGERNMLNNSLIKVTEELNGLKSCPAGWRMFSCPCYFLSNESGSWEKGREDCKTRGADLVVINSSEEQMFLSNFTKEEIMAWIGLTDRDKEGTWMWINGAPLSLQ